MPVKEYPPAFKANVALAAIRGEAVDRVARQNDVSEADVKRWQREFLREAYKAFTPQGSAVPKKPPRSKPKAGAADMVAAPADSTHSYSRSIVYWGRILETLYNRKFVAEMRPARIPVSFWRILSWLSELGTLTVGEIAAHSQIERTVLGRVLDRMAQEDLIARVPRRDDRRVSETRITPKGREAVRKLRPTRQAVYAQAARGIEPADLDFACAVLIRMINNLGGHKTLFPAGPQDAAARGLLNVANASGR